MKPRHVFAIILAALTVLSALSFDARFAAVLADDGSDCRNGQGDTAIRGCSRIIKSRRLSGKPISKKNLGTAYFNRGVVYYKKDQYDRAIADFDQSIELNPKDAPSYYNRGVAYSGKGQHDRAIANYDKAIKLGPQHAGIYNDRGVAYMSKGQYDRAVADYGKAIKLDPKYALAYGNRGLVYEKMGQRDKALADYRKAIELRPGDRIATGGLKRLRVVNEGRGQRNRSVSDDKKDCFMLGLNPKRDLDTKVKIRACSRVIDSGSLSGLKLADVYNRRAFMRCLAGDFDGASDDAIEVLVIAPHGSFEREEAVETLNLLIFKKCV